MKYSYTDSSSCDTVTVFEYDSSTVSLPISTTPSIAIPVFNGRVTYVCPYCGRLNFRKRILKRVKCSKCGKVFEVVDC